MTNGEKIKEIFPDTKIITQYDNPFGDRFMVFTLNNEDMQVNIDWWNAEYKEPTTKNELVVDCIRRKSVLNTLERMDEALDVERTVEAYKELLIACYQELPSVTPQEPFINKPCVSEKQCEHDKSVVLDKIDEVITDALDKSTDQKESQTLRWVLDKISEVT